MDDLVRVCVHLFFNNAIDLDLNYLAAWYFL